MDKGNIYLRPEEKKFFSMAVVSTLDKLEAISRNPKIPWTPESRKVLREMTEAGNKLRDKLKKLGFDMRPLPDLEEDEENDYLTKES